MFHENYSIRDEISCGDLLPDTAGYNMNAAGQTNLGASQPAHSCHACPAALWILGVTRLAPVVRAIFLTAFPIAATQCDKAEKLAVYLKA